MSFCDATAFTSRSRAWTHTLSSTARWTGTNSALPKSLTGSVSTANPFSNSSSLFLSFSFLSLFLSPFTTSTLSSPFVVFVIIIFVIIIMGHGRHPHHRAGRHQLESCGGRRPEARARDHGGYSCQPAPVAPRTRVHQCTYAGELIIYLGLFDSNTSTQPTPRPMRRCARRTSSLQHGGQSPEQ